MLIKLQEKDFDRYVSFVYELALDQTRSSYPTYTDGIKTREDFIRRSREAFGRDTEEILLFEQAGRTEGWIHYRCLPEDSYLDLCSFNVRSGMKNALREFLIYVRERFSGYGLYLGFPRLNVEAVSFLQENGFDCIEESFHDVLFFENYNLLPEAPGIVPVTRDNFAEFRKLHDRLEGPVYWNSDRLLDKLEDWNIYLCCQKGEAAGAIYYTDEEVMLEIFGVDFREGVYNEEIFAALLTKSLNEGKKAGARYFCFFTDQHSHPACLKLGFHPVGEYVCYWKTV